jgi:hypothetical protein
MSKVISILTPTRGRPDNCKRFIKSIYETTLHKNTIELFFYVDRDDSALGAYMSLQKHCYEEFNDFLRVEFMFGDPISVCDSWNLMTLQSLGDIIIMGNDDLIYETPSWDVTLHQELLNFPDDIFCAWFNDGINGEKHCAFPIVSRKWANTLGYCFAPRGTFHFGYNDTWTFDLGKRADCLHYIPQVKVSHHHFSNNKANYDETYKRNREDSKGNFYSLDGDIFSKTIDRRIKDVIKLQKGDVV